MRKLLSRVATAFALLAPILGAHAQQALPYGLKPGKPFAGQVVNVLAVETPQFVGLQLRDSEFTQRTGIKVAWTFTPFRALQEKIAATGAAKSADFDIINFMDAWAPPNAYWLTDLNPLSRRDGVDLTRYPSGFIAGNSFDGKLLGMPSRGHAQLFYYRKDIFDRLGLKPPATWDDVIAAGEKIREANLGVAPLGCYYGADGNRQNLFVWFNFLWGSGAEVVDRNGKPGWSSPAAVKATEDYIGLHTKHKLCGDGAVSNLEQDARISFAQGKVAMVPGWWWFYSALVNPKDSTLRPDQVAFTAMPGYGQRPPQTLVNAWGWAISGYSKQKEAAWEFIKWATNPDLDKLNAIERQVAGKTIINNVVMQKASMRDAEVNKANAGVLGIGAISLEHSRTAPMIVAWPEVGDALSKAINKAAASGGDVRPLMEDAARDAERALRRSR